MKQAVMTSPGVIEFRNVPVPKPGPEEVLIRVRRIGVCGSDIHVRHGRHPFTSYPVVQGHEFSGVIEVVGKRVKGLRPGRKVTATPQIVCGRCAPCRRGDYHICDVLRVQGFQAPGCAQELFLVRADQIVPLPASFSFEQGALVTVPLETTHFPFDAYRAAYDYADREGERSMKIFVDLETN
jgi:L-iditol 2-dehydrogenase